MAETEEGMLLLGLYWRRPGARYPSKAATCCAVAFAEPGFWPVTKLPSTTTWEMNGSLAFS